MATLKTTLAKAEEEAAKAEEESVEKELAAEEKEQEVNDLTEKLQSLEEDLDAAESRLTGLRSQYEAATKAKDEGQRSRAEMQNRGDSDTSKVEILENQLAKLNTEYEVSQQMFEDVSRQLTKDEEELDQQEERAHQADIRVKELESEAVQVGNTLRSMEINENVTTESQSKLSVKIQQRKEMLNETIARAEHFEREDKRLQALWNEKDDEKNVAKSTFDSTKLEYDSLMAEVENITALGL